MRYRRDYAFRWFAGIVLVLGIAPSTRAEEAAVAPSASVTLSERRAAEAFQAYAKDDYALAVALYLEAYKAAPSGSILYNLARIYDTKLLNQPQAGAYYQRYVAAPGAQPELVQIANQRLRELREGQIKPSPSLEASSDPARDAHLSERPSPAAVPGPSDGRRSGWSRLRWTGVAAGAAGLVGMGVGSWFGVAAMSDARTANELCDGNACASQAGVDAARDAGTNGTISSIAFGAGVPLLAIGAALFFVGGERTTQTATPAPPRSSASHANIRLETRPTASGLSLRISGRW